MFKKSLKYEMKASSRLLVPLFISVIALSAIIAVSFWGVSILEAFLDKDVMFSEKNEIILGIATSIIVFMTIVFIVLIVACSISVFVLMVRRFYTSFFTDEGYLTFTLPVTVDCHLGVKTVAMMIWYAVCDAVILLSCGIFALGIFVIVPDSFVIDEATLRMIMESVGENFGGSLWMSIVMGIVSGLASYFLLFLSISIGCMLTKKYRFVVCAICYFAINGAVGGITNIATTAVMIPFMLMENMGPETADLMYVLILMVTTVVYSALGAGSYFGTRWILKNKVNLD